MEQIIKKWMMKLENFYEWKRSSSFVEKILISFIFAFLTGLSAQISIRLPFTPVPITGQVFVVLLSGLVLGKNWGSISQMLYLVCGISGIPWFAAAKSTITLFSASFGYIVGFIPASFVVGYFFEKGYGSKSISRQIFVMLSGISIIYLFGAVWFSFMMKTGIKITMIMAVLPFIPFDIVKAYLAAYIGVLLSPSIFFNGKQDKN